jgi:DNA-binding transcriptional LysR family regulator
MNATAPTLRQLELFVAVARLGRLDRAGERLGVSRAAASMALSSLEQCSGGPLFTRAGRGLRLNDRGRRLLPGAEGLVRGAEEWLSSARGTDGELSGELRVGCSQTIGGHCLPRLLPAFLALHPKASISIRIANSEEVAQGLRDGSVDIGLVETDLLPPDLEARAWGWDEMVLVTAPGHPLLQLGRPVRPTELNGQRWLLREPGSGTRRLSELFIAKVPRVSATMELGSGEAIKEGVAAGLGLALLSLHSVHCELEAGRLGQLPLAARVWRSFHVLSYPGQHTSSLCAGFRVWLDTVRPARKA